MCKNLNASNKVETRMIWGCQWDVACSFIANKGEQKSIIDSSSWGNYVNSTEPANTGNYEQAFCKNTGSNEAWKANNIYDLAGNIAEWTQEAYENTYRASRGGNFFDNSATFPASNSVYTNPDLSGYNGFRYTSIFNNKTIKSID